MRVLGNTGESHGSAGGFLSLVSQDAHNAPNVQLPLVPQTAHRTRLRAIGGPTLGITMEHVERAQGHLVILPRDHGQHVERA